MRNIGILLYRDLFELKNKKKNIIFILIAAFFPIMAMMPGEGLLTSRENTMRVMILLIPAYVSMEFTLSQTVEYIKCGIYEKYFINKSIKKYQMVMEKVVLNAIYSTISLFISFFIYVVLRSFSIVEGIFTLDIYILIGMYIMCFLSAALSLLVATVLKNEKNMVAYMILLILIVLFIFYIFQVFDFYSKLVLGGYFLIVALVITVVVAKMFTSNRFVNRDM